MKYLSYKGATGNIEYSQKDELLYGRVLGIKTLLPYKGAAGGELYTDFKSAIDEFLTTV